MATRTRGRKKAAKRGSGRKPVRGGTRTPRRIRAQRRPFYDFESCVHLDPLLLDNAPIDDQARHPLSASAWAAIQRALGPPQGRWPPESYRREIEGALGTYCARPLDRTVTTKKGRLVLAPERLKARRMLTRARRIARAAGKLRAALLDAKGEEAETHRRLLVQNIGSRMGLGRYAFTSRFDCDTEALLGALETAAVNVQPIIRRDVRRSTAPDSKKKKPADPFLEALICELGDIVQRWTGEPLQYHRGKVNTYGDADWGGSFAEVLRELVNDVPRLRDRGGVYDVARATLRAHGTSRRDET